MPFIVTVLHYCDFIFVYSKRGKYASIFAKIASFYLILKISLPRYMWYGTFIKLNSMYFMRHGPIGGDSNTTFNENYFGRRANKLEIPLNG